MEKKEIEAAMLFAIENRRKVKIQMGNTPAVLPAADLPQGMNPPKESGEYAYVNHDPNYCFSFSSDAFLILLLSELRFGIFVRGDDNGESTANTFNDTGKDLSFFPVKIKPYLF